MILANIGLFHRGVGGQFSSQVMCFGHVHRGTAKGAAGGREDLETYQRARMGGWIRRG